MRASGVQLVPIRQFGTEARLGWVPSQTTLQNYGPDKLNGIVSHQHPTVTRGGDPLTRLCYNGCHEPHT
jgi:hypothetical protein